MIDTNTQKLVNRLKRVEGQVRGLIRMIDNRESLKNIFAQTKAIKSALSGVEQKLIEQELTAVKDSVSEDARNTITEIQKLLQ